MEQPFACGAMSLRHNANSFDSGKTGGAKGSGNAKSVMEALWGVLGEVFVAQECGSNATGVMLRSKTRAESLELDENLMFINKSDTAAARRSSEPF